MFLFWLMWNYDVWPARTCKCWPSGGMLPQEFFAVRLHLVTSGGHIITMLFDDAFHNYYDSIRPTRQNTLFLVTQPGILDEDRSVGA